MKNPYRGFVGVIVVVLAALLVAAWGVSVFTSHKNDSRALEQTQTVPTEQTTQSPVENSSNNAAEPSPQTTPTTQTTTVLAPATSTTQSVCGATEHVCPCTGGKGYYCLFRGAMCKSPDSACGA